MAAGTGNFTVPIEASPGRSGFGPQLTLKYRSGHGNGPFEGLGVDTNWELSMPRASKRFDYTTIADVLHTSAYTALDSFDYRQQFILQLDNRASADRPSSFCYQMTDQW